MPPFNYQPKVKALPTRQAPNQADSTTNPTILTPDQIRERIKLRSSEAAVRDTLGGHVVNMLLGGPVQMPRRPKKDDPAAFDLTAPINQVQRALIDFPFKYGTKKPRAYQEAGLRLMRQNLHFANWDLPGLGKSLQAAYASVRPLAISAPLFLCEQWYRAWLELFPADKVMLCADTSFDHLERSRRLTTPDIDVFIWNHEMMRYQVECNQNPPCAKFRETGKCPHGKVGKRSTVNGKRILEFEYPLPPVATLIADEAHHFRGRKANMSRGIAEYARSVPLVFELTATPIFKEADDLYMQLHILYPQIFNEYWKFVDTWCVVDESQGFHSKVTGTRRTEALTRMLKRYGVGRDYNEAGRELPRAIPEPPNVTPIYVELNDTERRKYDYVLNEYTALEDEANRLNALGVKGDRPIFSAGEWIDRLNEMTVTQTKLNVLKERVEDVRRAVTLNDDGTVTERERGVLIFTWLRDTAAAVAAQWPEGECTLVTGAMVASKRGAAVKATTLAVVNMAALAEGVDLSEYHHVIYFELYYVPGLVWGQALPRVLRERVNNPDDKEPVVIDYIIVRNTIDEVKLKSLTTRELTENEIMDEVRAQNAAANPA